VTIVKAKARKALIATMVVVTFVLVVQGVYAVLVSPLQLSTATDKKIYQMGEPVKISLTLRNVLLLPADIVYYDYLFECVVQDDRGNEIYRFARLSNGWADSLLLMPSQTKTETLEWNQVDYFKVPVSVGTYRILGSTSVFTYAGKEYRLEAETTITIKEGE